MWHKLFLLTNILQLQSDAWIKSTLPCECGKPSDDIVSMRIVGGRRAVPHSFPWTVAFNQNNTLHCGGALITDRHVLSAGHCFKWTKLEEVVALIGLDKMNDMTNVETRYVSRAIVHEDFRSTAVRDENDIAIAVLDEPVQFNKYIIPVCLPQPRQDFGGRIGTIVGWGRMGIDKAASQVLLKATLPILTDEECYNSKLKNHLEPSMMCTYYKGKDGCQGDSGGPLLVFEPDGRYVQVGVVSWGIGCADNRYPGVYTKVSYFIDWVKKHSASGNTCAA